MFKTTSEKKVIKIKNFILFDVLLFLPFFFFFPITIFLNLAHNPISLYKPSKSTHEIHGICNSFLMELKKQKTNTTQN